LIEALKNAAWPNKLFLKADDVFKDSKKTKNPNGRPFETVQFENGDFLLWQQTCCTPSITHLQVPWEGWKVQKPGFIG